MNITNNSVIAELVARDYRTAAVFKKEGIDFCCNGNRSIEAACSKKQLAVEPLLEKLKAATLQKSKDTIDYNSWPIDLLADYIEKKHHRYVAARIREIPPFLAKVAKVHGDSHPELETVAQLFAACAEDLSAHMQKEEQVLFPYIRKMMLVPAGKKQAQPPFGSVQHPISVMEHEHAAEGDRFRKIAELTDNYTPPADACNTYKVTFSLLKEFEEDLHLHIHLENNILFPKSVKLEAAQLNSL